MYCITEAGSLYVDSTVWVRSGPADGDAAVQFPADDCPALVAHRPAHITLHADGGTKNHTPAQTLTPALAQCPAAAQAVPPLAVPSAPNAAPLLRWEAVLQNSGANL